MGSASNYYYNLLTKDQQRAYYAIMEGLRKLESSFSVPRLTPGELSQIYAMVRLDHPEIFYSVTFKYRFFEESNSVEMFPEYMLPPRKLKTHIQAMESRVTKLARAAEKLSDWDKEKYIHDFIIDNVTYDKLKKAYSHEIIGALGNGVAVCEGISKAVKVLCDRLGIWCIVALCQADPENGIKYRHAWNVLKINGTYYHLDVTFDNTLSKDGNVRYDYFNLGDTAIFRDHQALVWPVPACPDHKHTYYMEKKLSFTIEEDVRKRSAQAVKKGRTLIFHWRGGYLSADKVKEFFEIMRDEAMARGKVVDLKLNWPQAIFQATFVKGRPQTEIQLEEANEGELYDAPEAPR